MMKTYDIAFMRNEVHQSNLARAYSKGAVKKWFNDNEPDAKVINISVATADSMKPSKPIIIIED